MVNLLGIFDGDMPVLLYLTDTKQYLRVPRHLYASGHPLLFKELESWSERTTLQQNDISVHES